MRNLIRKFIIIAFFCLFVTPSMALDEDSNAQKKAFSIEDCIEYALKNDPNIEIAKSKVEVHKSQVGQAKSSYFPTLGAGTGYNFTRSHNTGNRTNETNMYTLDMSVNQLIWDFGKTAANINMQKYNYESSKYDLDYEILRTTYNVKTAYYSVLAAKANSEVLKRTVNINELNYERTNALFEEGLKSKIDVVNAEVYYTDAKIRLLEAENAYETALIQLANAMYYTDTVDFTVLNTENFNFKPVNYKPADIKLSEIKNNVDTENAEMVLTSGIEKHNILEEFTFKPYKKSVSDAVKEAYEKRPDLKSLNLVLKASEESLKAVKRTYYPKLAASAGYGLQKNDEVDSNSFRVYAGLDFPTINIMNIKTKIDEGKAYHEIAEENVGLAEKNIYFEVQNYYVDMKQLEKRIPLMARKVEQTLENFELADGRYTVGLGNFVELQDAQTNYNNAQLEFVQTVFRYNVAREQFLKSMGVR